MTRKSSCSHRKACFALAAGQPGAFPAFSPLPLYDSVPKISAPCLLCQTWLHCLQSHHLPVPWPYWGGCMSGGVEGKLGDPCSTLWPMARVRLYGCHLPAWGK